MMKTLFGIQAGKSMEAIVEEYIQETIVGGAVGFVAFKVLGHALDIKPGGYSSAELTAEEVRFTPTTLPRGTKVYRVVGSKNNIYGECWTTVDPRKVKNFADAAGIPEFTTAKSLPGLDKDLLVVEGELMGPTRVRIGPAENGASITGGPTVYNSWASWRAV